MSLRPGKEDPSAVKTVPNAEEKKPVTGGKSSKLDEMKAVVKKYAEKVNEMVVNNKWFEKAAKKAFKEADVDQNGVISLPELCLAVLRIYETLNIKMPTHIHAPKREHIVKLFNEVDVDKNGTLDFDEFHEVCKKLVGITSVNNSILFKVFYFCVLRLAILPFIAALIHSAGKSTVLLYPVCLIPGALIVLGCEMAVKSYMHFDY